MFVLWSVLLIVSLICIYKFSDKYLIPLIVRKFNNSPNDVKNLYNQADSIAKNVEKEISKEKKEALKKEKEMNDLLIKRS